MEDLFLTITESEDPYNVEVNQQDPITMCEVPNTLSNSNVYDPFEEVSAIDLPVPQKKGCFKCDQCDMKCKNRWLLDRHIKAKHQLKGDTMKECPYCNKVFGNSQTRAGHMALCCQKPRVCNCSGACNCKPSSPSSAEKSR